LANKKKTPQTNNAVNDPYNIGLYGSDTV